MKMGKIHVSHFTRPEYRPQGIEQGQIGFTLKLSSYINEKRKVTQFTHKSLQVEQITVYLNICIQ